MWRRVFALCLVNIVLSILVSSISRAESFNQLSSRHVFDNGLTVVINEIPTSPMVSVYGLVKAGSATEGKFLGTGISHFLEHMLFKGTTTRKVGEVAAQIQAVGGHINASTGMDYTIYTLTVPFDAFDIALDILADMLMNSMIDVEEVEKERTVIFGEMRLHNDNPDRKIYRLAFDQAYLQHPYRHPVIGYKSLLADVSQQDLLEYYHNFYAPNNIILSIAGNIHTQDILPKINKAFENFKRQVDVPRNLPKEPVQISYRRYEETYSTDLARLSLTFGSTRLLHPDLYALDVLAEVLGQGRSSRLYLKLYKKQDLVHSISASNYTPMDRGIFQVSALLETENIEQVIDGVLAQIALIQGEGVLPEELEKAKRQALSSHVFRHQTSDQVAYSQAIDEAFTGDFRFSQKYVEGIQQVTLEDVRRVAQVYLKKSALTVVVLKPEGEEPDKKVVLDNRQVGVIQKYVLDNGLTVLLREDATFPLISMRLMVNGGTRQEDQEHYGISQLTASLWTKGTEAQTSRQIAEKTEAQGMRFGSYSGKNSFGLSLECLAESQFEALDLLEDIVKNSIFPEDEMVKLKTDMKTALRQRDNNIFPFTSHALKNLLFKNHPFRVDGNGTMESIDRITQSNVKKFYEKLVVPNNMVLTLFGDIDVEKMLAEAKQRFGTLPRRVLELRMHQEESLGEPRLQELLLDKEQAMVMLGFHGVSVMHNDHHGLEVMASILGSSFSGRLFNRIREELGKAYTLGGGISPGVDTGMIYFYVLTTQEHALQAKILVEEEIQKLQKEYVSDEELTNIKMYLKGNFKADYETNASLGFMSGLDELYGLGFKHYQTYDQRIDAVSKEDVQRLAQTYLDLTKVAVVVTLPGKNVDTKNMEIE